MTTQYHKLRLILGDQLNASHSWYKQKQPNILYLIAELPQEVNYVKHHTQKIVAFFAAMQAFANGLQSAGHQVLHLTLDESQAHKNLPELLAAIMQQHQISIFEYQRPDENRLLRQLRNLACEKIEYDTEHFYLPFDEFDTYLKPGKSSKMEFFYRKLRKRFDILMDDQQPVGGKWNYDAQNRKSFKPADIKQLPEPLVFANPVKDILSRLQRHQVVSFGKCEDNLLWPINRSQALELLKYFCRYCLPLFGQFQDAMTCQSAHSWSLYHSRLSFALNSKMLSPKQVIAHALAAYHQNANIDLAQIEGFVRQILGWREFVRLVYWQNTEQYSQLNYLNASRTLPSYFWHGKTKMNCMQQSINQSLDYAYAHHIQRLMVIGNFCLLTGINPEEVDAWYLGIYIDAIEWVEMPNTRGMALYADGGLFASKPYASSGAYINRMSDYCKTCYYDVKQKTGRKACPFNSLYWTFLNNHRPTLGKNPRLAMPYRNWDKMDKEQQQAIIQQGQVWLDNLQEL
ncbi:cryptochrome/photolyase family protein [Saccharobesus litoralis]|uniref:Cryptochrome/photolyase family protein n=1 Tax=Saccharobesus litoralis TaxID=2172099 RepID=A0A2S0VWE4_9ALTE|nr:cryptochrome/photolyase family protein [Saccharobesus litoralis]AWB68492.1 cryptochrome/photolyase family protein [Saccharobesus litoralis]